MQIEPITLNSEILERMQERVQVENREQMIQFVTDALNTYMHLGQLAAGGAQFLARDGDDGEPRRLRFPFQADADEAPEVEAKTKTKASAKKK